MTNTVADNSNSGLTVQQKSIHLSGFKNLIGVLAYKNLINYLTIAVNNS